MLTVLCSQNYIIIIWIYVIFTDVLLWFSKVLSVVFLVVVIIVVVAG